MSSFPSLAWKVIAAAIGLSSLVARAADPAAATSASSSYVLRGRIGDSGGLPLAEVRVGLRGANVAVRTDAQGEFALMLKTDAKRPLVADRNGVYETLEVDKDGYLGREIDIKDLAFFANPLNEKMVVNPVTEDRAEFSMRMEMHYILPSISTNKKFDLITPEAWAQWQAGMDAAIAKLPKGMGIGVDSKMEQPKSEQVVFQAYVPKGVKKVKAVFLLTRHGIGSIDHARLRAFADRNGVGLVGVKGNPVQRGFYPVNIINPQVKRLGEMLKHPELGQVPVITFGHSNGTGFSGIFASQQPDHVIGWISYHSGSAFHLQFPNVEKVPGLVMHGLIDPFLKNGQVPTVIHLRAERNAAMAMMMEGNVAHGPVDRDQNATWDFIAAFAEATLRTRLNEDGTMKPVAIEQGWLGATYDLAKGGQQELAIAPYAQFQGDKKTANWLPDETFAKVWQAYGMTDPRPMKK